jgi:hypothetical protein
MADGYLEEEKGMQNRQILRKKVSIMAEGLLIFIFQGMCIVLKFENHWYRGYSPFFLNALYCIYRDKDFSVLHEVFSKERFVVGILLHIRITESEGQKETSN